MYCYPCYQYNQCYQCEKCHLLSFCVNNANNKRPYMHVIADGSPLLTKLVEKTFYNRETISAAFFVLQQMSTKPPFFPCNLKKATLFLIKSSQPIMKKGRNFSQW